MLFLFFLFLKIENGFKKHKPNRPFDSVFFFFFFFYVFKKKTNRKPNMFFMFLRTENRL